MERRLITKKDAVILVLIVIFSAVILIVSNIKSDEKLTAVVTVDGAEVLSVNLSEITEEQLFTLDNGVVIKAYDSKICFYESNCKDKICINSGELSNKGEVAACVPNKTVIKIEGSNGVDALTY